MVEAPKQSAAFHIFCRMLQNLPEAPPSEIARQDWGAFVEGARRHRVGPLLLSALRAERVPEAPLAELRRDVEAGVRASLLQMREMARLATGFDRAHIPMMALKGVALSLQLGRDPTMRQSRDIDLLIAPGDLARGDHLMRESGYQTAGPPILSRQEDRYRRWGKEIKYVHPQSGVLIELHYRLADNPVLLDWDFADLWRERETIDIAGVATQVMPWRYLALYLCVHGAVHGWERLCWLLDLKSALEREGALEEALAAACAQELGAPMLQAMMLAHDWLGLPVPEHHLARARTCPRVARLMRLLHRSYGPSTWYRAPARNSLKGFLHYSLWQRRHVYWLKPGFPYWKNQIKRELMAPADWEAFSLGENWAWAYPLIRPVGWLVRRLGKL